MGDDGDDYWIYRSYLRFDYQHICLGGNDDWKEKGSIISYDPNYRASLWQDEETAKKHM